MLGPQRRWAQQGAPYVPFLLQELSCPSFTLPPSPQEKLCDTYGSSPSPSVSHHTINPMQPFVLLL